MATGFCCDLDIGPGLGQCSSGNMAITFPVSREDDVLDFYFIDQV